MSDKEENIEETEETKSTKSADNTELLQTNLDKYVNTNAIDNPVNVKEYFAFLQVNMDDYSDVVMDEHTALKVRRHLMGLRTGTHATVPLICAGANKCPIVNRCPLLKRKPDGSKDINGSKFPVLRPCPFEKHLMAWKIQAYVEEYDIDINSHSSVALVTKLAELDIYEMRIDVQLSSGDRLGEGQDLLQRTVEAMNPVNGRITESLRIHPLWDIKERIGKQRQSILTSLIGTPKEKLKAAHMLGEVERPSDLVREMSSMKNRLSDLIKLKGEVIDAEFEDADNVHSLNLEDVQDVEALEDLPDDDM